MYYEDKGIDTEGLDLQIVFNYVKSKANLKAYICAEREGWVKSEEPTFYSYRSSGRIPDGTSFADDIILTLSNPRSRDEGVPVPPRPLSPKEIAEVLGINMEWINRVLNEEDTKTKLQKNAQIETSKWVNGVIPSIFKELS